MNKRINTIFENGKPVATSDTKEKERLEGRIGVIDEVLKDMGYGEGYSKYQEYLSEIVQDFSGKYLPFLERVDELSKERGV